MFLLTEANEPPPSIHRALILNQFILRNDFRCIPPSFRDSDYYSRNFSMRRYRASLSSPAGSKRIEEGKNWGIGKYRTFLSLPTHHFASPKLYLFLSLHLSRVTRNIYLFLSLCLVISIPFCPLVYPLNEVVSIFFSIFRDRPLVSFSIPHLSPHSGNFTPSLYPSVSILTTKWRMQF